MDEATLASLRLWIVMNRAKASIEAVLCRQVQSHGLTLTEFAVLEVLLHKGSLAIGEIGERVLLTSGSMTYVVDKLEKRRLLYRRPSETDRRVQQADLTPEGKKKIEAAFADHAALIRELMDPIDLHQKTATADILKRLGLRAEAYSQDEINS